MGSMADSHRVMLQTRHGWDGFGTDHAPSATVIGLASAATGEKGSYSDAFEVEVHSRFNGGVGERHARTGIYFAGSLRPDLSI